MPVIVANTGNSKRVKWVIWKKKRNLLHTKFKRSALKSNASVVNGKSLLSNICWCVCLSRAGMLGQYQDFKSNVQICMRAQFSEWGVNCLCRSLPNSIMYIYNYIYILIP